MPGLIDAHRHIIGTPIDSEAAMNNWLDKEAADAMYAFLRCRLYHSFVCRG